MPDAPHPRILFQDVPDRLWEPLTSLAGEVGVVTGENMSLVHSSDWDLVVSFADIPFGGADLHILSFGGERFPPFYSRSASTWRTPTRSRFLTARTAQVDEAIENRELRQLLERTVVANDPGPGERYGMSTLPRDAVKLVTVGEEKSPWAVMLLKPNRAIWALPKETTQHVEWLAYVLRFFHEIDADRFPAEPDWRLKDEWATPDVRRALAELAAVERDRERVLAELTGREATARDSLAAATGAGAPSAVRLLTEDGEELVAAVAEAFQAFGFDAQDMDDHHDERTGAKLEDLRVSLSADQGPDWTAIVEVKGYSKGARANDVAQILNRPPMAFFKEQSREPEGIWHVANSLRGQDPSTRPVALASENDLVVLAAAGGCFIDTRDLFRAWRDVAEGVVAGDAVRESLMAARERWTWPEAKAAS